MAPVSPRWALVHKFQKRLSDLNVSQLLKVASLIDDGSTPDSVDDLSEPELYDLIVDYIRGEKLAAREDGGMAQLLLLDDVVSDLVAIDMGAVGALQTGPLEMGDSSTIQQRCSSSPHCDHHPPADTVMPARNPATSASAKPPTADSGGVTPASVSTRELISDNCSINILNTRKTISDFIDEKIQERCSEDNEVPFCVANLDSLIQQHNRWLTNLPRVKPFYAVKCNNTSAVIRTLCTLGAGFDCASKSEIEQALSLGAAPEKIIFAHTTKFQSHIKYAYTRGVEMMTFDCEEELLKISKCHSRAKLVLRIAVDDSTSLVRLNQKFGANQQTVEKLLKRGRELGLEIIGVSFHVGSGCTDSSVYRQAIEDARHVFDTANLLGFHMRLLDIGGGFPGDEDFQLSFEEISEVINETLDKFFPADSGVEIIAEPGRYYVCTAFTLAVKIFAKNAVMYDPAEHKDGEKNPDRMMMYYINDGIYGCFSVMKIDPAHPKFAPYPLKEVKSSEQRYLSIIWGPTCDNKDKIVENYWMPEFSVGEWLLFDNIGAYSVIGSTGFNGFECSHIYPVMTSEKWKTLHLSHSCSSIKDQGL